MLVLTRCKSSYPIIASPDRPVTICTSSSPAENHTPHIIDIDAIEDDIPVRLADRADKRPKIRRHSHGLKKWPCDGILVAFPDGKNQHISYPFRMHSDRTIPWNYKSIDDKFYIQSKSCKNWSSKEGRVCDDCENLTSTTLYTGIMDRIRNGAHENIPLVYHGVGGLMTIVRHKTDTVSQLRMSKLNDSRKLLVKVGALEDHKQFILAIASGRVD